MTECNQSQFEFEGHFSRRVVAEFSGERLTTEGGALLLRATDRKIGLLHRVVSCFTDARDPQRIEHALSEMLVQRVYSLALGYEDLNDHEELRNDPLLGMLTGRRDLHTPLGGQEHAKPLGTDARGLPGNRTIQQNQLLRRSTGHPTRRSIYGSAPRRTARDRVGFGCHRHAAARAQEARFFHGYYGHYCYLPLYVFCGDHLLCARLRPSNIDASAGSLEEVQRIVRQIRGRWPKTRIILRADSGFCREELLAWCENNDVDYVFGFARNKRLRRIIGRAMREAKQEYRRRENRRSVL